MHDFFICKVFTYSNVYELKNKIAFEIHINCEGDRRHLIYSPEKNMLSSSKGITFSYYIEEQTKFLGSDLSSPVSPYVCVCERV